MAWIETAESQQQAHSKIQTAVGAEIQVLPAAGIDGKLILERTMTEERREILKYALVGMSFAVTDIEHKMREISDELLTDGKPAKQETTPKRKFSPTTRKRMAAAQKARWAKKKA